MMLLHTSSRKNTNWLFPSFARTKRGEENRSKRLRIFWLARRDRDFVYLVMGGEGERGRGGEGGESESSWIERDRERQRYRESESDSFTHLYISLPFNSFIIGDSHWLIHSMLHSSLTYGDTLLMIVRKQFRRLSSLSDPLTIRRCSTMYLYTMQYNGVFVFRAY